MGGKGAGRGAKAELSGMGVCGEGCIIFFFGDLVCDMAGIELGPEGGQALGKFLQGNNTLRSLRLNGMPKRRTEGRERKDARLSLSFFVCVGSGRLLVLLEAEGRREGCEAAGQ